MTVPVFFEMILLDVAKTCLLLCKSMTMALWAFLSSAALFPQCNMDDSNKQDNGLPVWCCSIHNNNIANQTEQPQCLWKVHFHWHWDMAMPSNCQVCDHVIIWRFVDLGWGGYMWWFSESPVYHLDTSITRANDNCIFVGMYLVTVGFIHYHSQPNVALQNLVLLILKKLTKQKINKMTLEGRYNW